MSAIQSLQRPPTTDLDKHREFIQDIGDILEGRQLLSADGGYAYVYRVPSITAMERYPRLRKTKFGLIKWNAHGTFTAVVPAGSEITIIPFRDPNEALEFLSSLQHLVQRWRREIALPANKEMERSTKGYSSPSGAKGHLLKEYDQLLKQIEHEHFRQRDLKKGADYHST